jgi:gliding motility-associated-like protein
MTLTVVSAGPCEDIVLNASCTAEDCPPPTIVLTGQDSACLNNPTIIDLDALVNGSPGVGTWAGPGITDPAMGLFDPQLAAAGQHQVTFTAVVNGCPFTEPYLITVFDSLTADFTLDPVICETDVAGLTFTGNASASAVYDFDFGPATVVSGTGPGPYQLSWASPGSKTVRLQVSENGCMSDIISHTTDVIATLNPPVINCSPNTSGILFTWTIDPAASAFVVNTLTGPTGNPIGMDSLEFTGMVPGDTAEIEIISISAGPCPDRRDTLLCIARLCPMPVITITPVNDICLYPGTAPVDLNVTVTNGAGSGTWAGPGITDVINGIFNPVLAGAGSHLVTFNYTDDGCDFVESITINVYDVPDAFISNTDLMITCATGSIFLDGSSSSGAPLTYQWSTATGVINGPANASIAEVTAQGVYKLVVTNSISGCKDSTSVTVTQDSNIPTADAGPDKTLDCNVTSFALGGNSTTGPDIIYSWSTSDGNIVGLTNGLMVTVDQVGQYDILVRDTVTGCQATDRALVGIDTAVATIILTPGDTIDCNTSVTTAQSTLSEPVSDYTLTWSTLDGTIVGGINGQSIDVSQGGTYTLTIKNKLNGCENSEDVFIPESDEIIDAVDASVTNVVCHGDNNGTITVHGITGGVAPYTYTWSGTGQSGTDLVNLGPGSYSLTVSDQNGCTFTQTFQVIEPELVTISVGPDMTVQAMDSVIISLITNLSQGAVSSIDWSSGDGSLNCPGCPTIQFIASSSTSITAMIVDTSGCDATDSMRLTVVVPRIYYIPNVFSPNDDGNNDYFTIYGRFNLTRLNYLRVFDRWGNQLFEKLDFDPNVPELGWDGRFNGESMLPGVYVYSAELEFEDGRTQIVHGDVTIMR